MESVPNLVANQSTEGESEGSSEATESPLSLDTISDKIKHNPFLPDIDEKILLSFMEWAGLEATLDYVTHFYKTRQHYKKLFRQRQPGPIHERYQSMYIYHLKLLPTTGGSEISLRCLCVFISPSRVVAPFSSPESDQDCVVIGTWLADKDPEKFSMYHLMKLILTELDLLLMESSLKGKTVILVIDLENFTTAHLLSITKFAAHVIMHVLLTAVPARIHSIILVSPLESVADLTNLFPKLDFRIAGEMENLVGFVPRDVLPSDMAGNSDAPTRDEFAERFQARLRQNSSWLVEEDRKRDEELYRYSTQTEPKWREKLQVKT